MAATKRVWPRPVTRRMTYGEAHGARDPPSRAHTKGEPGSEDENVKLAEWRCLTFAGPASILVSRAVGPTEKARPADAPPFPAWSVARPAKACGPSASPV